MKSAEGYHSNTIHVLKHYPEVLITRINAEKSPLEVLRDILINCVGVLNQHNFNVNV
jgi:hypothetical protein